MNNHNKLKDNLEKCRKRSLKYQKKKMNYLKTRTTQKLRKGITPYENTNERFNVYNSKITLEELQATIKTTKQKAPDHQNKKTLN